MTYAEAVAALNARENFPQKPPSLLPMREALHKIGFEQYPLYTKIRQNPERSIIVAGTNGKGSVCATLEALLSSAGELCGLYTSPHLVEPTERMRLNGIDISKENFARAYDKIAGLTQGMELTQFEMLTLMAVWYFGSGEAGPVVDRLILEVGLGGTWDATNAIPHGMAIITTLGIDHENLLGKTLPEIAENKFGVVQKISEFSNQGMKVIHSRLPNEVESLMKETVKKTGSQWFEVERYSYWVDPMPKEPKFFLKTEWGETQLGLQGYRAAQNTALALTALAHLGFDPAHHMKTIPNVRWPGRMQRVMFDASPCPVYLSGDHNVQGLESLGEILGHYRYTRIHFLVGLGLDKDFNKFLKKLQGVDKGLLYITETPFRGRSIKDYGFWLVQAEGAWKDPIEGLQKIFKLARPEDLIVVTGSLYLVGGVLKSLQEAKARSFTVV